MDEVVSCCYRLSTEKMTVSVDIDSRGYILDGAPIIQRFRGQHFGALVRWMQKQPGFCMQLLSGHEVSQCS